MFNAYRLRRLNSLFSDLIELASGDYHEKYVPDSPFLQNPLLEDARSAALKKTKGYISTSYKNMGAGASEEIKNLQKGKHKSDFHEHAANASPLAKEGLLYRKYGIANHEVSNDMRQALDHYDKGLSEIRSRHQAEIDTIVQKHGGTIHRQWVPPGKKIKGKTLEPTLHESWRNYAVNINDRGMHTEHLARMQKIKESQDDKSLTHNAETKSIPGSITPEGITKGSKSKLGELKTKYGKEIMSNKTPFKGYKQELLGSRMRARQAMAEELGYKFHPGNKEGKRIEVTGKRQIIQAQRKLSGTYPSPLSSEKMADIKSNRPPRGLKVPSDRPRVGLAGATPEQAGEYHGDMKRVESKLSGLIEGEKLRRSTQADSIKSSLKKRAYENIKANNPHLKHPEIFSKHEVAVNSLLHGSADPKRSTGKLIEGRELARHAETIGIPIKTAKNIRTQYRNLTTDTEIGDKKLRSGFLKSGAAFLEDEAPKAAPHNFPHLKKLGIGAGIAAGAIGAGYLARRIFSKKKEARMSAVQKLITFAAKKDQRTIVSRDRYTKQIKSRDLLSAGSNYLKSAGVGAAVGAILRKKMPLSRALTIGAGSGLAVQAGTRISTAQSKDQFGERTWQGKLEDRAPAAVGAAVGAGILGKRHIPKIRKFVGFSVPNKKEDPQVPPIHDIATGAIEGGLAYPASEWTYKKLIGKGAPSTLKKITVGGVVGGAATGLVGVGLAKIIRASRRIKQNQESLSDQLSSRTKLIQFALDPEEKEARRSARRWEPEHLKARGQEIYTRAGRGFRAVRDIKNTISGKPDVDSRGRPRKKEWQKPWFYKSIAIGTIGLALTHRKLLGSEAVQGVMNKFKQSGVGKYISGLKNEIKDIQKIGQPKTINETINERKAVAAQTEIQKKHNRNQVRNVLGMRSKLSLISLATTVDYWDARDLSRNQAVVTAPGGQIRTRRKKKFHERKAVRDAGFAGLAGVLGIGAWQGKGFFDRVKNEREKQAMPLFHQDAFKAGKPSGTLVKKVAGWTPEGWLKPRIKFQSKLLKGRTVKLIGNHGLALSSTPKSGNVLADVLRMRPVISFQKKGDHAKSIAAATGTGGVVAGGLYRGRGLKSGEDITGRRVTRPHNRYPFLQHEGIGMGDGNIAEVHYTPDMGKQGIIKKSTPEEFAKGHTIKVLDRKVNQRAAQRATAAVGTKMPYSLLYNNCQKFGGCARKGRSRILPRQLRTALAVGGVAAGAGYGATKLVHNRKHEFKSKDHPVLRDAAIAGGLGAAGIGAGLLPGASKMLKIGARDWVRGTHGKLANTKGLGSVFKAPANDPNLGGRMVFDYIDASQKLLNRGLPGKATGKLLQHGMANPHGPIGKTVHKVYPGNFGPSHFARFRSGYVEALNHWDYEHGAMLKHRMGPSVNPRTGRTKTPRPDAIAKYADQQTKMHYGREKVHAELRHALDDLGMNEKEALHHVATKSSDPHVHNYFNQLSMSKSGAAKHYAKLSLSSPALIAGGLGTAAIAHKTGKKK